jgi:hypothetical protein
MSGLDHLRYPTQFFVRSPEEVRREALDTIRRTVEAMQPGDWVRIERGSGEGADHDPIFTLTFAVEPTTPRPRWAPERQYREGWESSAMGRSRRENPYEPGGTWHASWIVGFDDHARL